jgi:hypothetical protein
MFSTSGQATTVPQQPDIRVATQTPASQCKICLPVQPDKPTRPGRYDPAAESRERFNQFWAAFAITLQMPVGRSARRRCARVPATRCEAEHRGLRQVQRGRVRRTQELPGLDLRPIDLCQS